MGFQENWDDMDSYAKKIDSNSNLGGFELLYNTHTGFDILTKKLKRNKKT